MTTLSEALELVKSDRIEIIYKCGSIHRGYMYRQANGYWLAYNKRSLVATRVNLEGIRAIRYANSRVYLFRSVLY